MNNYDNVKTDLALNAAMVFWEFSFYVFKDEINKTDVFLSNNLEARKKNKNVFVKWYERLSGFCDRRFGPNWKDEDPEFWNSLLGY